MLSWWDNYWHQWLLRRQPKASVFTLNRRNLYTFPGTSGFVYLGLTLVLWLIGTNYQNNLILALAYGLISVFVIAILHAYANLAGIKLEALPSHAVFAEETAQVKLRLTATNKRGGENIRCLFRGQTSVALELPCQQPCVINLPVSTHKRGWLQPGRLLIETYYPLGLIRCWTWLVFDVELLVYPKPLRKELPSLSKSGSGEQIGAIKLGGSDFEGIKNYTPGDSRKHIAWKAVAKGKGLLTKYYVEDIAQEQWLDLNDLPNSLEERLSILTYWVLQLSEQNQVFGLRLNAQTISPNQGSTHRLACLSALALHPAGSKK
ncbi:MAG TPA: DUF58 domain-containing protein [Marinagarivorans sp.]|nr:DUF58 domain-containing protein [Marinagarivorans sp.]